MSGRIIVREKKEIDNDQIENILNKKFKILKKEDPIYLLKSIKNNKEIKNMISSHIIDGAALTKFLYWIKMKGKRRLTIQK